MGHETLKRIILEKYGKDNYLVCGDKKTEDYLGVTLEEALENIRKQMLKRGKTKRYSVNYKKIKNATKK